MKCICKPWRGHHLPECPCQTWYEKRRAAEVATRELSEAEAEAIATRLVREGWRQQSRKYRRLIKVPPDGALAELERVDPVTAQSLRHAAEIGLEAAARQVLWHFGETQELSLQVFEAFRVAVAKEGK